MSIYIGALSPMTYDALDALGAERNWSPLFKWIEPETCAWLVERLKHVPDSPDVFPNGKWATIQRLEEMLTEHALECEKAETAPGAKEGT